MYFNTFYIHLVIKNYYMHYNYIIDHTYIVARALGKGWL